MRRGMRTLFLLSICFSFTVGFCFAAEPNPAIVVKAVIYDNDTGARLTTSTRNVGVRLLITNQSSSFVTLHSIQLGRLQLIRMEQSLPNPNEPFAEDITISWPLSYMNPYGPVTFLIDAGLTSPSVGTVLPIEKASFEGTDEKVKALKAGYYFPFLVVNFYDDTGGAHVYGVKTELVEVESGSGGHRRPN